MKLKRKALSILMTLCFLAAMIVPTATPAFAAGDFTPLSTPNVDDGSVTALGGVFIRITAGSLRENNTVNFRLPSDFVWVSAKSSSNGAMTSSDWSVSSTTYGDIYGQANGNYIEVPDSYGNDMNGLKDVSLSVKQLSDREISVTVNGNPKSGYESYLYIYPNKIWVEDGHDGTIDLVATVPSGSGFPPGTITIGNVSGGEVDISVSGTTSFTDNDKITIRLTEDTAGSLEGGNKSLELKLPSGFVWSSLPAADSLNLIWGKESEKPTNTNLFTTNGKGDTLYVNFPSDFSTTEAMSFEFDVTVTVDDETKAKTGDVTVKVSGETDVTPSEFSAGSYGTYDSGITAGDPTTVYAGMLEQKIAPITIAESVKDSIIKGRTLTLELPENARWGDIDTDSDNGLSIDLTGFPGTDGKIAKFTFDGPSTKAAELVLEDLEVSLEPGVTGDLVIKVGGTAGLSGELTVAEIISPITAEAASAPEIKIGTVNAGGDVTISETEAGAIKGDKWIVLDLPTGVRFANKPSVEVIEGDLDIDTGSLKSQEDDNMMTFKVDSDSTEASTLKLTDLNYIVDRTVAEGNVVLKVKGSAVANVNDSAEVNDYYDVRDGNQIYIDNVSAFTADSGPAIFSRSATNASVVAAKVVTPAPTDVSATVSFVIGSTTYTVNGVEATMDVAPYLKSDRTFLPVRFVANALGVADANIMWNQDEQSVVIIKGDRVIKLTMNSNIMLINGVPFTMDVAPELVDPGRTMLPLRAVAQALGADVQWDEATQTVTVTTI